MAKITVTTDKSGRKVYKVAGTKKYAYSMAKAREIAAKESGPAVRKSASTGRRARDRPTARGAARRAAG